MYNFSAASGGAAANRDNQSRRTQLTRFYQLNPPIVLRQFTESPTTILHLVSYSAQSYFQQLAETRGLSIQNKEYVLADSRLQYMELLNLEGCIEINFKSGDDDDAFLACPVPFTSYCNLSWVCDEFGWISVPPVSEEGTFRISGNWWSGLKYSLDVKVRALLQFQLFEKKALRLFVIPVEAEQYSRVVVVTNTPVLSQELERDPQGACGRLLAHQLLACPAGDWVGTMDDVQVGGTSASDRPKVDPPVIPLGSEDSMCQIPMIESQESISVSGKSKPLLSRQYSRDISGQPLPVAIRQSYTSAGLQVGSTHLFPHQQRTVTWMLAIENGQYVPLRIPQAAMFHQWYAYPHGMEKAILPGGVETLQSVQVAVGGLVAHPVGSGKTIIAIELLKIASDSGPTLVCVPSHITKQWEQELKKFAPHLPCQVVKGRIARHIVRGVVIVPYELFESPAAAAAVCGIEWWRVIFDEPQDIAKKDYFEQLSYGLFCPRRWLLTGTPNPIQDMIQLALGYKQDNCLPLESMQQWFVRTRCRRDPPGMCLPIPPLHIHMLPVTLTWQEMSVVRMHAMEDHLQASVRLCSYFANVDIRGNVMEVSGDREQAAPEPVFDGVRQFKSLDDWIVQHQQEREAELMSVKTDLHHINSQVSRQFRQFQERLETMPLAPGQPPNPEDEDDHLDEEAMEIMFDEHSGVDPELLTQRKELTERAERQERLLCFLKTVAETISSDTECTICMEPLGLSVVTMLPCLHAFCAVCVIGLFGRHQTTICPVCRSQAQRRELCTFKCSQDDENSVVQLVEGTLTDSPESEHFHGSKLYALAREVGRVLDTCPNDKILIFAQWESLLKQTSSTLPFESLTLSGTMEKRCHTLKSFQTNQYPRVLLLSLEQHASGANLDMANHVFIVHPYCPASVASTTVVPLSQAQAYEQQAIGRVLRFPQSKEVHLYRLYARGTVEEELYMHWGWA